ncbi:MAG TPA: Nif3-like dinuclear metal center hexameric protein [Solirubrobacterales bacterium]|jgi:dinuclear metal center YbgI/SA1388 family protein|nr:Nif3-like dinuclear metal center hexameric protein [Solirubrobacterales bacterium]
MAKRDEISAFCDELLDVASFDDYGPNGLQVPGQAEVSKVATGVSANLETLQRAVDSGAELVLTHHGLLWGDELSPLSLPMAARLRALLCSDVSLAAYHLPLDAHAEIGNNALLRDALDLDADERPFGHAKGSAVGLIGRAREPIGVDELRRRLSEAVGREPLVFDAGPERISTVGIVTGAGGFALHEAGPLGLDALVTGEPSEPVMGEAREYGVHFLAGGHYATETLGIRRLGELVAERFSIEQEFIDVPNPI